MKRLLAFALFFFCAGITHAQTPSNVGTLAQRPTTCVVSGNVGPNNQFIPSGAELYYATDNSTIYVCITTNTWQAFGGGGGSGTISGSCSSANQIAKFTALQVLACSSGFDAPPNPTQWPNGVSIMQKPLTELFTNGSGGTTQYLIAAQSNGTITTATTGEQDSGLVVGVVYQGAGTSGNVQVAVFGQTPILCDNQTVVGDWVQLSATTGGECHDGGAVPVLGELNVGTVYAANTGSGTQSIILSNFLGAIGANSNPPVIIPINAAGVTSITSSYTVPASANNGVISFTGNSAGQTVTLPTPGTGGTTAFVGATAGSISSSAASTTVTRSFTAGNMAFVQCISNGTGTPTISGVSDNQGDTFTTISSGNVTFASTPNNYYSLTAYALNVTGGSTVITCTASSTASNINAITVEYAHVVSVDTNATAQISVSPPTSGQNISSPSVTTAGTAELIIGSQINNCNPAGSGPGAGYTSRVFNGSAYIANGMIEDKIVPPGTYVADTVSSCGTSGFGFGAQAASFFVTGTAPSFLNGFNVWIGDSSTTQALTVASAANMTTCTGTTVTSLTIGAAGEQDFFESNGVGWVQNCGKPGSGGGGSGTVTAFSSGNLSPLFTTSVATSTTTPALSFSLSTAAAHSWLGNNTGSMAAPGYETIGTADLPFTYTTTNGATLLLTGSGTFTNGHCVAVGANGNMVDNGSACGSGGGGGTVTSVGLSLPGIFSISGSPVTTTGTLTAALANESANLVWAGPSSGSAATPTFRALVSADIPNNAANTSGNAGTATALAATPSQCSTGMVATGITANGTANCTSTGTGSVSGTGSVNSGAMFTAAAVIGSSPLTFSGSNTTGAGTGTFTGLVSNGAGVGLISFTTTTTVSGLPSAGSNVGAMAVVTDSTTISSVGQTCVGSGSVTALAFSDGTNWHCYP